MAFAELAARSHFSFLEGASSAEDMVGQAKHLGLDAIAVCDRDGLYGIVRAHVHAKKVDQKLIVGAELTLDPPLASLSAQGGTPTSRDRAWALPERILLLVEDATGYRNLCRALTLAHADHEKGTASISMAELAPLAGGLVLLIPDSVAPPDGESEPPGEEMDRFFDHVSVWEGRAAIAVKRCLDGRDGIRTLAAEILHRRYGTSVVATGRPLFHHAKEKPVADVIHCIRHKTTLDEAGQALRENAEARLKSGEEMERLFRDHPEWVRATLPIAERCRFSLNEIKVSFPSEACRAPGESADQALRRLTDEGVRLRFPQGVTAPVAAQIEKELALIAKLGVAPFFLSVREIVEMARVRRILCQGRGSAANSAVCYALGITAVDPSRSNLLFERFLSAERNEPPDIDVDFEHERREEVIQAIYETYGRERAAMVSEVIAYRGKSALREVGKAFGLSLDQVDLLSGVLFRSNLHEITPERIREVGLDPDEPRLAMAISIAKRLEGAPRHLSIHVGGFVLSAEPLDTVAPIEPARMEGRTVIPWDKDDVEALGFFKMDVLALGMLTAIRKCLGFLHERGLLPWSMPKPSPLTPLPIRGEGDQNGGLLLPLSPRGERGLGGEGFDPIEIFAGIPREDPATYEAIGHADTVGVFQIESRAQMSMLPRLKPRKFYDLVIEVAIVRPGPIQGGMVHPYLRRRNGQEPIVSPHPCLDEILERTLGVPLFQEQVMQIAMVGAGYSGGEADQLRRDMAAWKKHGRLERHHGRLLEGFEARGISRRFGEQLYKQIQGFGEYGFPESHAASFALLVYASAWLKTHHPAAFACALLDSQPMGFYTPSSIVQDAQRHGVVVKPVCVLVSEWDHSLEEDATSTGGYALRLGMRLVRGFGQAAGKAVVDARNESPLRSVMDLVTRAHLKKNEIEALAEGGALSGLVPARREALWEAHAPRLGGLFHNVDLEGPQNPHPPPLSPSGERGAGPSDSPLPKWGEGTGVRASGEGEARARAKKKRFRPLAPVEQLLLDYGRLGLSVDDHPMRYVRPQLQERGVSRASELGSIAHGRRVRVAGVVIGRQRPGTASGVTFVSLEDETGVMNLIVTLPIFEASRHTWLNAKIILVEGKLEKEGEVIHVLAHSAERLELRKGAALDTRSRDFR